MSSSHSLRTAPEPARERSVRWRDHLRYRFDKAMSRGTGATLLLLALATVVFILAVAFAVVLLGA